MESKHDAEACTAGDCTRPPVRGGLCWTHDRHRRRGLSPQPIREEYIRPPVLSRSELLGRAALRYADAELECELRRARDLLRKHGTPRRRQRSELRHRAPESEGQG